MGEPDPVSGVTLHIRFNGSTPSVMQLSQAEFRQLKAYMGSSQQLLQWLAPKLSGREAFIHFLMDMTAGLSEQDEGSRQQIEKQIDTLAEWPDHEFNLEFEWEQLGRTLTDSGRVKDKTAGHEPDTETIYEGEDINRLIYQAMNSQFWGSQKSTSTGATGSGNSGSYGQRGGRSTGGASDREDDNDERRERELLGNMEALSLSKHPVLRIVFVGQQDVGKSSLGNRLVGWKPFKVIPVFNENSDPVYRFGDLEIRSLKGYGDFDHDADYFKGRFIQDQEIHPDDLVVFVFDHDLNGFDKGAISALTKNGNKIVFVCNKIDTCVDQEKEKELFKKKFEENLKKLKLHKTPELVFACSISEKQDELVPTKKLEDVILSVLEEDKQKKELFEHFIKSRIRPDNRFMTLIKKKIEKKVQDSDGKLPDLKEINSIVSDTIVSYIIPKVFPEETITDNFKKFNADFNKVVNKLKNIVPDEDCEFFLKVCNESSKKGYSKETAGVTGAVVGGAVGTQFGGSWGSLAGAALGGTLGGLIGIGGAMSVNYLFMDDLRINLTEYRKCREDVQKALDKRMKNEISKISPQKVQVMIKGVLQYHEHHKIKKIRERYRHIMEKFDPWVHELGKIIKDATQILRRLVEDVLTYYQLHFDEIYALTYESVTVSLDLPETYEEVPNQSVSNQAIQQVQPDAIVSTSLPPAKPAHILQNDQPLPEEMTVEQNAEVLQAPHTSELQSIQDTQPAVLLRLVEKAADGGGSMGKWAKPLYGIHLRNGDLFDEHIGDMTEPVVVAVSGYGVTDDGYAFLLFRNSKNGEFNSFHILQGRDYPEFMDKEATVKYLRAEKKQLKDALSVNRFSDLYGREADLGRLREIYSQLFGEKWNYKKDNNCMTFSLQALDATPLNRETWLHSASPQGVHSPYHIMKAFRESEEKDYSAAMHNPLTNNLGLPDWLINPIQP